MSQGRNEYMRAWRERLKQDPDRYREMLDRKNERRKLRYRRNAGGHRDKEVRRQREKYHRIHPEAKYYLGYGTEDED